MTPQQLLILQANPMSQILMMLGMMAIFFFFIILPQMRRQKKDKEFRQGLKTGDKIITSGGVYGKIVNIEDQYVSLEIDKNVVIKIERTSIRNQAPN